jgi:hypothetical protein
LDNLGNAGVPFDRAAPSQRAQIIRHIAEFPDHLGIAEIALSGITSAAERDRANAAFFS